MPTEEINMEQHIPASEAARALGVSTRTMNHWLNTGELRGDQSVSGRWTVPIGELFRILEARGFAGKPAEAGLRDRLKREVLPKYQMREEDAERRVVELAQTC
jgi:hypothetical protein